MLDFRENDARRLQRAATFDEAAELYDRARACHPAQLFDDLFDLAGIAPAAAHILEIGCGTGQATLPLAQRGSSVTCVEPGPHLAAIARRKLAPFPRVTVIDTRFEDFESAASFDIVLAVNSWHWIDPALRYAKAAAALKPPGVLAFTIHQHVFPDGFDPFFAEIQDCYEALGESRIKFPPPPPDRIPDARAEIEASGCFEHVRIARRLREEEFTAQEHVDLMSTASDHRLMDPAKRERLFADMRRLINARTGGRVRRHMLTILHVATKKNQL